MSSSSLVCDSSPGRQESGPLLGEGLDILTLCIYGRVAGALGTWEGDAPHPSLLGVPGVVTPARCSYSAVRFQSSSLPLYSMV